MARKVTAALAALVVLGVSGFVVGVPAGAASSSVNPQSTTSYVLVDDDTGNVLQSSNAHTPLPPASVTKLLTALVAVSKIPEDRPVVVSARAERMPPMKIGLIAGETWTRDDLLHSLLMVSANDAAVALAEAASGSVAQFATDRQHAATQLGLQDSPVFNDPAGLDDADSFNGGDRVSARDMAIIARAALGEPVIRAIVGKQQYTFVGGDSESHKLTNHNKSLSTYAGSIGMKPGYTTKAKSTMVTAATRNGRTMIAVVMGADNPYVIPTSLMDQGFATPVASENATDHLERTLLPSDLAAEPMSVASPSDSDASQVWVRRAGALFIVTFAGIVLFNRYRNVAPRLRTMSGSGSDVDLVT